MPSSHPPTRSTTDPAEDGPTATHGFGIASAWAAIEACPFKDSEDGTCGNPHNPTPECHAGACPLVCCSPPRPEAAGPEYHWQVLTEGQADELRTIISRGYDRSVSTTDTVIRLIFMLAGAK